MKGHSSPDLLYEKTKLKKKLQKVHWEFAEDAGHIALWIARTGLVD